MALLFRLAAAGGVVTFAASAFVIWATGGRITLEPWLFMILGGAVAVTGLRLARGVRLAIKRSQPLGWRDGRAGLAAGAGCLLGSAALTGVSCLGAVAIYVVIVQGVNP